MAFIIIIIRNFIKRFESVQIQQKKTHQNNVIDNGYMLTTILTSSEDVVTASPRFSWERFVFSKTFIELPMENKGMFMVNYSTKNSQCQEKIKNIMSCCIDLHYLHTVNSANQCNLTYLYRYDLRINMSRYWSGDLSWFVPSLYLFQLCQPDHKNQLIKNYYQIWSTRFPKQKTNLLPSR